MKLAEVLDGGFMVNQLRKLIAHQEGKLAVKAEHGLIFTVTDLNVLNSAAGKKFLKLYVLPLPTDSASSFLVDIAKLDQWELKKDGSRYILQKKQLEEGREEWPLLVSMLGKLVSHSFHGGPQVVLDDIDFQSGRITGYSWDKGEFGGKGELVVTVRSPNHHQDLSYAGNYIEDGTLKLIKVGDEWRLRYRVE